MLKDKWFLVYREINYLPKLSGFFRSETQKTAANRAVGAFFRHRRICKYVEEKKCETSDAAKVFKSQQKRIAQFRSE